MPNTKLLLYVLPLSVAFAADIYGADLQENLSVDQRKEQTSKYRDDTELFVQRMQQALEEVKKFNEVDTDRIAVMGKCFGGTGVIQLAFSGNDEVKRAVSFHGGLADLPFPQVDVKPYTLTKALSHLNTLRFHGLLSCFTVFCSHHSIPSRIPSLSGGADDAQG
jgi:predicted esterase